MICYRDMTFCTGDGCKKFASCHRALTDEVKGEAKESGLHISQFAEPRKLECWTDEEPVKEEGGMLL